MFDQEKMAQMVVNLAKDYTTVNMQVMKTTMEQFEKTMNALIKQGTVAQDEGTKLFADWWNRFQTGSATVLQHNGRRSQKYGEFVRHHGARGAKESD